MPPLDLGGAPDQVRALERRLARERAARLEAEAIAERVTSELYETVRQLTRSNAFAELLGRVAVQANESASSVDAIAAALTTICAHTGWPVGHAFVLSVEDAGTLVSLGVMHAPADGSYAEFLRATAGATFRSGEGLPGRTLAKGEPQWIADLGEDDNFPRRVAANACGLRAAFAAPILVRSDTVAVLEFFAPGIQPPDEGLLQLVGFVGAQIGRVLERERAEERLVQQAMYDSLTGLPNRVLLMDRLRGSLARAQRADRPLHVLFLDVDDFKTINDSRGHGVGDRVLAALATRLLDALRASDSMGRPTEDTVARLGGDEFAVVLEDCADPEAVALRIHELLRAPLQVDDHEVFVSVSIGSTASTGQDGRPTPDALIAAANVAMHESRRAGKSRHTAFEPRMHDDVRRRDALGADLRVALDRQQFWLAFQPVVDLASSAVTGAEALLRWDHPERGTVPPDEFIGRAEETGLIVELGTWVLRTACRQAAVWRAGGAADFTVAVNVSGRQLKEADFAEVVRSVLAETDLPPSALCLELTESILMERDDAAISMLSELRAEGVHLAIDDFGTGYSSLGALRTLPVDLLKIDRSFIRHLPDDDDAGTIAWAVIRLGHTLGLPVLAEGVETTAQCDALRRFGCDRGQGFLFGRPVPADELGRTLQAAPG